MAISPEQNEILQNLATLIRQSSGGGSLFGQSSNNTGPAGNKSVESKLNEKRISGKALETLNKSFKDIAKELLTKNELKKFPKELKKTLAASNNDVVKKMAGSIETIKDVMSVSKQLDAQNDLITTLKKYEKTKKLSSSEFKELKNAADAAGKKIEEFVDVTTNTVKNFDKLENQTAELDKAFENATIRTARLAKSINYITSVYDKHGVKIKQSLNLLIEENRLMRERVAGDAKYSTALVGLGISMKDWTIILSDNRATQQAMASGGRDFTEELVANSKQMRSFSFDNVQAAKTTAQFAKNVSGFGVKQKDLTGAVAKQISMYDKNFRVFGMTAEAFGKYTEELIADTDIRNELSIMQKSQRQEYILGIQAQESYRRELGYTAEQARELTKIFAKMSGESPRERLKKAAKQRAMLGALGQGAEGAELQKLMVNINQLQGKDKVAAKNRIEEIQRGMSNALQKKYGESLASEFAFRAMADKTGVTDLARTMETRTKEGKVIDRSVIEASKSTREIPAMVSSGLDFLSTIAAFQATSVGLLGGILLAVIGRKALLSGAGIASKAIAGTGGGAAAAGGALSKMAGGAKGAGKLLGKVAAPLAGVIAGYEKYAEIADDQKLTTGQKTAQVASTGIVGAGGAWGGALAGAAAGALLGPIGAAVGGLIGAGLGAWGGSELGEVVGEGISDLMGDSNTKQATKQKIEKETMGKTSEDSSTVYEKAAIKTAEKDTLLLTTLQELQQYLKNNNEQNTEQAKAVTKTAEAVIEGIRFNSIEPRRS